MWSVLGLVLLHDFVTFLKERKGIVSPLFCDMKLPFLLLAVVVVAVVHAVPVTDLTCDTALTANGVHLDDLVPAFEFATRTVPVIFKFNTTLYQEEVYIKVMTDTVVAQGYQLDGNTTGKLVTWDDIEPHLVEPPGAIAECEDIFGCDGFVVKSVEFRRLFPANATEAKVYIQIQYAADAGSSVLSGQQMTLVAMATAAGRRLLAVTPENATVIGLSDLEVVTVTFSSTITNLAFDVEDTTTSNLIGIILGSIGGFIFLVAVVAFMCSGRNKRHPDEAYGRRGQLEMRGHYGNYEQKL